MVDLQATGQSIAQFFIEMAIICFLFDGVELPDPVIRIERFTGHKRCLGNSAVLLVWAHIDPADPVTAGIFPRDANGADGLSSDDNPVSFVIAIQFFLQDGLSGLRCWVGIAVLVFFPQWPKASVCSSCSNSASSGFAQTFEYPCP